MSFYNVNSKLYIKIYYFHRFRFCITPCLSDKGEFEKLCFEVLHALGEPVPIFRDLLINVLDSWKRLIVLD